MALINNEIPKLRVQRMGKKWRIVHDDSRVLARFNGGEPVDDGGFEDQWQDGRKVTDGQMMAIKKMSDVIEGQKKANSEDEGVGSR